MNTLNEQKTLITIDSKFRDSKFTNPGEFTYILNETIKNVKSIVLNSIEFPNLYYSISSARGNNFFTIKKKSSGTIYTIILADGIYSPESMIAEITSQLNDISASASATFAISLSDLTFKVTIDCNVDFDINFENTTDYFPLGYYLGYRKLSYTNSVYNGSLYKYTSESIMDTTGENYLFLKINDFGNVLQDFGRLSIMNGEYIRKQDKQTYFAKIQLNGPKMSMIFYNDTGVEGTRKYYDFPVAIDLRKLQISLVDTNGHILDMMGFDYSFTLEVIHYNKLY